MIKRIAHWFRHDWSEWAERTEWVITPFSLTRKPGSGTEFSKTFKIRVCKICGKENWRKTLK